MDKKYIGRTIALPKAIADDLQSLQTNLIDELGFQPSLAETIAWLIRYYDRQKEHGLR